MVQRYGAALEQLPIEALDFGWGFLFSSKEHRSECVCAAMRRGNAQMRSARTAFRRLRDRTPHIHQASQHEHQREGEVEPARAGQHGVVREQRAHRDEEAQPNMMTPRTRRTVERVVTPEW